MGEGHDTASASADPHRRMKACALPPQPEGKKIEPAAKERCRGGGEQGWGASVRLQLHGKRAHFTLFLSGCSSPWQEVAELSADRRI